MNKRSFLIGALATAFFYTAQAQQIAAPKPYGALPARQQLNWEQMQFIGIVHFGLNTFTDKEWGYGNVSAQMFNPKDFDPNQIVLAAKSAGIQGLILVCKHHDGFCLWPTKTTDYNITKSPWMNGHGDLVKAFADACKKNGLKFGVYCSPWDRNSKYYGSAEYLKIYREQLKELYTNYGDVFESWHDGANGGDGYYGGANEVRKIDRATYYQWDSTWAITRRLQPGAAIFSDVGPDVRWVGNEYGYAADTTWVTFTPHAIEGGNATPGNVKYWENPTAHRDGKFWMPLECDVPLRPGFFYHESQEGEEKSASQLFDIYVHSAGRSGNMNLGLAPDKDGQLSKLDVTALKNFGELLRQTFSHNLAEGSRIKASNIRGNDAKKFAAANLLDKDIYSYWATDDSVTTPDIIFELPHTIPFNIIELRENIKLGQRISSVAIDKWDNNEWEEIATATGIGACRLIKLPFYTQTNKVRLRITASPVSIALSSFGLYAEPEELSIPQISRNKNGFVSLTTSTEVSAIHYTSDGAAPSLGSPVYTHPFVLKSGGVIKAISADKNGKTSTAAMENFGISKANWKVLTKTSDENFPVENAADDNTHTFWKSGAADSVRQIVIDLGEAQSIKAFTYLPRQDKQVDGLIDKYVFYTSMDGEHWQKAVSGEFANIQSSPLKQLINLPLQTQGRFIKFQALHVIAGTYASVAELGIITQ
ncbi:MAG TPA: alpha-L-fucosidase [Arachidicoccus sp.]